MIECFNAIVDKLSIDGLSKFSQIMLMIFGGYALYISHKQLKIAKRNTELNIAKNEIDIFARLNEKEKVFVDSLENYDGANEKEYDETFDLLKRAKEEYFRLFDTICLYVLNDSITLDNFCNQYKDRIVFIVDKFKDEFDESSIYKNIVGLHEKLGNNKM